MTLVRGIDGVDGQVLAGGSRRTGEATWASGWSDQTGCRRTTNRGAQSLELCEACDAGKPAAGALIRYFDTAGAKDTSRTQEGAHLLLAWTREAMATYGWFWEPPSPK
ncbi:DUF6300 family protein [Streptacidiphilus carbonis]|uniref:DUF6300 family protein n=1 Tax=Streptacidiphilus carbonis TaxID=105422 RepID=UPI000693B724